ncbi:hypothetical protein J3459_015799 [Metarhizium acridum]|nr:hypothetical protein J3459_015799 [Metarhizium acridum]
MAALEARMRALNLLESKPAKPFLWNADKEPHEFYRNFIEDDHVPFMQRGVNVLHIIPDRFPAVWHKIDDDGDHLDLPTTRDWARIVTAFVVEFMELGGLLDATAATSAGKTSATGSVHSKRTEL